MYVDLKILDYAMCFWFLSLANSQMMHCLVFVSSVSNFNSSMSSLGDMMVFSLFKR